MSIRYTPKIVFFLTLLLTPLCTFKFINSKNEHIQHKSSTEITTLLDAISIISSDNNTVLVRDLKKLFDSLQVKNPREIIGYIDQMRSDVESLIGALGAHSFEDALRKAQQFRSVYDQVLMLKDSIHSNNNSTT